MMTQLLYALTLEQRAKVAWFVFSTGDASLAEASRWRHACFMVRDYPGGF